MRLVPVVLFLTVLCSAGLARAQQQVQIHAEHLTALGLLTNQPLPTPDVNATDAWYDITPEEVGLVVTGVQAEPEPMDLSGAWQCRSIQSGGLLIAYRYFRCRITPLAGGVLLFEKISGSQRRTGLLIPQPNGTHLFLGGATVNDDPTHAYSGLLGAVQPAASDTVGYLFPRASEGRVLIAFAESLPGAWEVYDMRR